MSNPKYNIGPRSGNAEPKWVNFFAGGLGSTTAEICTLPIDTAKIRLQLQGSSIGMSAGAAPRYTGFGNCLATIGANEGLKGLYRGLVPALYRQMTYSSIRMGVYEPLRNFISGNTPAHEIPFFKKVLAGGTSGSLGCIVANPFDLMKIRMQADVTGLRYPQGLFRAISSVVAKESLPSLWTGVVANIQRAFFVNAAELATYDTFKQSLMHRAGLGDHVGTHFLASMGAGLVAAVVSNPIDLSKSRLMTQGENRVYRGMLHCIVKTVQDEGPLALYKGFVPNWMRLGTWCVCMFVSYEQYRKAVQVFWDY